MPEVDYWSDWSGDTIKTQDDQIVRAFESFNMDGCPLRHNLLVLEQIREIENNEQTGGLLSTVLERRQDLDNMLEFERPGKDIFEKTEKGQDVKVEKEKDEETDKEEKNENEEKHDKEEKNDEEKERQKKGETLTDIELSLARVGIKEELNEEEEKDVEERHNKEEGDEGLIGMVPSQEVGFREGLSEEEKNNVEEKHSKEEEDMRLRRMEPNLGKAGVEEGLSEEERRSLSSWLEEFSSHTHLPRAYQV